MVRQLPIWFTAGMTWVTGIWVMPRAVAGDGIIVLDTGATHGYGQQVTFTLRSVSAAQSAAVHLRFKPQAEHRPTTVQLTAQPSRAVAVQ